MINLIEYGQEQFIDKESINDEDRIFLSKLQHEDFAAGKCRFYVTTQPL